MNFRHTMFAPLNATHNCVMYSGTGIYDMLVRAVREYVGCLLVGQASIGKRGQGLRNDSTQRVGVSTFELSGTPSCFRRSKKL